MGVLFAGAGGRASNCTCARIDNRSAWTFVTASSSTSTPGGGRCLGGAWVAGPAARRARATRRAGICKASSSFLAARACTSFFCRSRGADWAHHQELRAGGGARDHRRRSPLDMSRKLRSRCAGERSSSITCAIRWNRPPSPHTRPAPGQARRVSAARDVGRNLGRNQGRQPIHDAQSGQAPQRPQAGPRGRISQG